MKTVAGFAFLAFTAISSTAEGSCVSLGEIAYNAVFMRNRNIPVESAQVIVDLEARDRSVPRSQRLRIRRAVALGYRSPSATAAEIEAHRLCKEGLL